MKIEKLKFMKKIMRNTANKKTITGYCSTVIGYCLLFIGYCLTVIGFASCTDLDEHPYTFIDPSSYYNNEKELNSALNTVYNAIRSVYNDGGTFMRLEGCTDFGQPNREGNKNNINDINAWKYQNQENNAGTFTAVWTKSMACINRANNVIAQLEASKSMDETLCKRAIAQAKFMRAAAYYLIVRIYGGAPIIKTVTTSLDNLSFPRATIDETFAFIIEDLEYCEQNLPARGTEGYEVWRVSKGAAQAYLANLYLYRASMAGSGGYTTFDKTLLGKAKEYCEKVINSGVYSLEPDFANLWCSLNGDKARNNVESIFELQYSTIKGQQNGMHQNFGMFADSVYPEDFVSFGKTISTGGGGSYYYLRTGASVEAWKSYDANDQRLKVLISEGTYSKGGNTVHCIFDPDTDLGSLKGNKGWGSCCPGNIKVHDFSKAAREALRSGNNFMVMRYAQVLLDYAEICNCLGEQSKALQYLNMVRQRAGLPAQTAAAATAKWQGDERCSIANDADAIDEAIFQERGWEFIGEGVIYFDELRTDRLGKRVGYFVKKYNTMKYNQVLPLEFVPSKTHLWWIPTADMSANSDLVQNPDNKEDTRYLKYK